MMQLPDLTKADFSNLRFFEVPDWGFDHRTVCHSRGEYACDEDGDGFHEVHVNTAEGHKRQLNPPEKSPGYAGVTVEV
jgi:hypothetical protein